MKNKPFSSPLWAHLDVIRSNRRARKTWQEIADVLEQEHGLKTSYKTIHAFFKRTTARPDLPLGWAEPAKAKASLRPVTTQQEKQPEPVKEDALWDIGFDPNQDLQKLKE